MPSTPSARPHSTLGTILLLWLAFYATFTLLTPPLLDDADSVHAEVAREMLLRHDYVTLYANGIRYLEKAPLLYWSIAASFKLFGVSTAAARLPLALTVLALALLTEAFARRAFHSHRAGLYAALILLSSPGIFLFTRLTLPDALVCLWLTLALYAFYRTEQPDRVPHLGQLHRLRWEVSSLRQPCWLFASACALNVLSKGLIGLVFPIFIVTLCLLFTRGPRGTLARLRQLHPLSSLAVFLAIAAPWHILIALANPTQGHPAPIIFTGGHWQVPLPSDGNVHGWLWFYFVNEQLLRYLNLRVPRDYDTAPLWLFWGLCLVWLMPWSAFLFKALRQPFSSGSPLRNIRHPDRSAAEWRDPRIAPLPVPASPPHTRSASTLLILWAATVLLFFSLSTRQEYYVLPALPALAILIAGWLALPHAPQIGRANLRITSVLLTLGTLFALTATIFLLHTRTPAPNTDLATLLQQNPSDYALSMGHFLDLNAQALGLFRLPLALAAASLFLGPLASFVLRRKNKSHAATLALAAGAFTFLLAAHLGLRIFSPVLTSRQLAATIAPQLRPQDLIVIHQEYEYGSTLGFYLRRTDLHILTEPMYDGTPNYGRSSNLWYGSFFPDAPRIFETPQSLAARWPGPQRIFLWQDLANQPGPPPALPTYVIAQSGGKAILSNQPNHP